MRNVLLCIFFLIFLTGFGQSITEYSHSPCGDSSWVAYKDEKCFKFIDEFKTHDDAEKVCNKESLPNDPFIPTLISIKSTDEQKYLNKFLFEQMQITENVWIAATRSKENSLFSWNDNSLLVYTNWAEGSPIGEAERDCVEMRSPIRYKRNIPEPSINVTDGKWYNVLCKKRILVLCQKLQTWSFLQLQKTFLDARKELQDSMRNLRQNPVPIGFIYVQLPHQSDPKSLWSTVEWVDVTSAYAGLFFRAEGGGSEAFGLTQECDSPRLTYTNFGSYALRCGIGGGVKSIQPGQWSQWNPVGLFGEGCRADGMQFFVSNVEVRPRNKAVRIWKRTK